MKPDSKPSFNEFDEYLDSPHVMYDNARGYYVVASISFNFLEPDRLFERDAVKTTAPIYYNLTTSVELAFKTIVLLNQNNLNNYLTHEVLDLYNKIIEKGWIDFKSNEDDIKVLKILDLYNMKKNGKNSSKENKFDEFSGTLKFGKTGVFIHPCYYVTCDLILRLFSSIESQYTKNLNIFKNKKYKEIIDTDRANIKERLEFTKSKLSEIFGYEGYKSFKAISDKQ